MQPPIVLQPWDEIRIPESISPTHYDLMLDANIAGGTFTGRECVFIKLTAPMIYLVIHIKYMTINKFSLHSNFIPLDGITKASDPIPFKKAFEYEKNEFYVIQLSQDLQPGDYTMYFEFTGNLTNGIVGFYRSSYKTAGGEDRQLVSSKFQPTYARRAYPCFDEPGIKATFSVQLKRPGNYVALSNMPVKSETGAVDAESVVSFDTSVKMVTYLSCFIVCDFVSNTKDTGKPWKFSVWSQPSQKESTQLALEDGVTITSFYEDYFGLDYPLPKQDLIAIPEFSSGAMEHWGLVTFRETSLLLDEKAASQSNKKRVSSVVGHELAHQWFGNLVTMKWWNDLWLNEGFASYMEYKAVVHAHPDWDMDDYFAIDDLHIALDLDAKANSHPIVQVVNHPDEITEIFDQISYSKGASVLRMLDYLLQEKEKDNFQEGVRRFLDKFKYGNAETKDLWSEMASGSQYDVADVMATWTEQMGYPVVTVEIDRTSEPITYTLTQTRFLIGASGSDTAQGEDSPFGYKWEIPISYVTNDGQESSIEIFKRSKDKMVLQLPSDRKVTWVKFNPNQMGYYRVNYPIKDWKAFIDVLNTDIQAMSPRDRAHLLNDAFSLVKAKLLDYSIALDLSKYLKKENHFLPWSVGGSELEMIYTLLYSTEVGIDMKKYLITITNEQLGGILKEIEEAKDPSTPGDESMKLSILHLACEAGSPECLAYVEKSLQDWKEGKPISYSWRTIVYNYGMGETPAIEMWDFMWEKYLAEKNPQEKLRLLSGLANTRDPALLYRYLQYAKTEVPSQDYFTVLKYISSNRVGNPLVWEFVRSEWEYLVDRFTLNDRYLGNLIPFITKDFTTETKLDEMKAFFAKYPDAGAGSRARRQALETVESNIAWVTENKDFIKTWLGAQNLL